MEAPIDFVCRMNALHAILLRQKQRPNFAEFQHLNWSQGAFYKLMLYGFGLACVLCPIDKS